MNRPSHTYIVFLILLLGGTALHAQNVPEGSLIIPMDNATLVGSGGQGNILKAYGLVYNLRQGGVRVYWAYSTTKSHDGIDFAAAANQVKNRSTNGTFASAFNYRGGPFIVDVADTGVAGPLLRAFANGVTVHQVLSPFTNVPIEHTLDFIPRAYVYSSNANNHDLLTDVLTNAGIPSSAYQTGTGGVPTVATLTGTGSGCFTIIMIPHEDALTATDATRLKDFTIDYGNVYLQCDAVRDFEALSSPQVLTTAGVFKPGGSPGTWTYPDSGARTFYGQFIGSVENTGGAIAYWKTNPGSTYQTGSYSIARQVNDITYHKVMSRRYNNSPSFGWFFYMGGHDNTNSTNLQRMLLNAFIGPATRLSCTPLPVELVSFSGRVSGSDVILTWRTATEANNHGFEVQRSRDLREWTAIEFIAGQGTSNSPNNYKYIDKLTPMDLRGNGMSYRLKQIDRDGGVSYSSIVSVRDSGPVATLDLSQNFPNPFNPSTNISFVLPSAQSVTLTVMNHLGQEVARLLDGVSLEAGHHAMTFSAENLPSGQYHYRLSSSEGSVTRTMFLAR